MSDVRYYFFHDGIVYKKNLALPILEAALSSDDCGYDSYDEAVEVVHECQDLQAINSLKMCDSFLSEQRRILDHVEILPSNHIALYDFLHS